MLKMAANGLLRWFEDIWQEQSTRVVRMPQRNLVEACHCNVMHIVCSFQQTNSKRPLWSLFCLLWSFFGVLHDVHMNANIILYSCKLFITSRGQQNDEAMLFTSVASQFNCLAIASHVEHIVHIIVVRNHFSTVTEKCSELRVDKFPSPKLQQLHTSTVESRGQCH